MKVKAIKVTDNKGNVFTVNKKDSLALKPRFKSSRTDDEKEVLRNKTNPNLVKNLRYSFNNDKEVDDVFVEDENEKSDFTKEELKALKELAKKFEDLLALVEDPKSKKAKEKVEKDEDDEDADLDDKEEKEKKDEQLLELDEEDDVEITEEDDEEFIDDQCDDEMTHDSKKSFGAIENRKLKDSQDNENDEIALAWAKRYGGK